MSHVSFQGMPECFKKTSLAAAGTAYFTFSQRINLLHITCTNQPLAEITVAVGDGLGASDAPAAPGVGPGSPTKGFYAVPSNNMPYPVAVEAGGTGVAIRNVGLASIDVVVVGGIAAKG